MVMNVSMLFHNGKPIGVEGSLLWFEFKQLVETPTKFSQGEILTGLGKENLLHIKKNGACWCKFTFPWCLEGERHFSQLDHPQKAELF